MKKIDSLLLVCSAAASQQLIGLGILPVACFCYESFGGQWDFAGEYIGQHPVLPAWTLNELHVLIGGDFPKPDLFNSQDWIRGMNMMQWPLYLPRKMKPFINAADAAAALLEHLLIDNKLKPEDCNARLEAFITKDIYNPLSNKLDEEAQKNKH